MNAFRIRRRLESETLHLPELRPLVGHNVEIIVLEEEKSRRVLDAFFAMVGKIDLDEDQVKDLREKSKL